MRKLEMDELNRKTVEQFKVASKLPLIIVLDNVRSMHNVGSIFRTADAFLLESIYLCGFTPRPPHRDIHKTALGSTETVDWKYFDQTIEAAHFLKNNGYALVAVEQVEHSTPLKGSYSNSGKKFAVIFGNEVEGVDKDVLACCESSLEIPQLGMKHSLNVSVAAGIVIWEFVRERISCLHRKDEPY